jgi:AbrB family looped-hinge helix DNA binding protein
MSARAEPDTIWFTTKGQVVIPRHLRKEFHIEEGTRAVVMSTPEGILIKPVTRHAINRLRGILKRKPGEKSFAQEWTDHKREELEIEERKYGRSTRAR